MPRRGSKKDDRVVRKHGCIMVDKLAFDLRTSQMLQEFMDREDLDVVQAIKVLVAGGCASFPDWGVEYAMRRRAYDETRRWVEKQFQQAIANVRADFNAAMTQRELDVINERESM